MLRLLKMAAAAAIALGAAGCADEGLPDAATPHADAKAHAPSTPLPAGVELTLVSFESPAGVLHGFLAKPPGAGPFPAFIWNHGSEKLPGKSERNAAFFTGQGFVFFAPHRLGHGRSPGPYIVDRTDALPRRERPAAIVRMLDEQADQVAAAVTWLGAQPFVDKQHMIVGGCSYGGIQTVLAAERGLGLRGAVDWAGAAMSWGLPDVRERMIKGASGAKIPIFFVQAEGDFSNAPSPALYEAAVRARHPAFIKVYPAVGDTHQENHSMCARRSDVWGADVMTFIRWSFSR